MGRLGVRKRRKSRCADVTYHAIDEDVSLYNMFGIVRSYMNGHFSVITGKDVTIENLGYYQTKPTSSKLFHTCFYSKSFFAVC